MKIREIHILSAKIENINFNRNKYHVKYELGKIKNYDNYLLVKISSREKNIRAIRKLFETEFR